MRHRESSSDAKKASRARNLAKNNALRAAGQHPKQLRDAENRERHARNVERGFTEKERKATEKFGPRPLPLS